jgi:hypothetical protein
MCSFTSLRFWFHYNAGDWSGQVPFGRRPKILFFGHCGGSAAAVTEKKEYSWRDVVPPNLPGNTVRTIKKAAVSPDSSLKTVVSRHLKVCLGGRLKAIKQGTRCLGQ